MQLPREVGTFFLARGLDARRQLPQLLLRFALPLLFIRDVGARSDVANQLAGRPEPRRAVADDPPVLAVCPPQPVIEGERRPVLGGTLGMARQPVAIILVDPLPPALSELIRERSPGESQPLAIEERPETVWTGDPQHDGRIVCDRAKRVSASNRAGSRITSRFLHEIPMNVHAHSVVVRRTPTACHLRSAQSVPCQTQSDRLDIRKY